MLYLDIADNALIAVQSNNPKEHTIDATSSGQVPDGVVSNGIIHDEKRLAQSLSEILSKAIPAAITDSDILLVVTDKQVFTKIFPLPETIDKENIADYVLREAKKFLPYEPTELENFFKVIESKTGKRIFYTAMSKATIAHYWKFLRQSQFQLKGLYSHSQAIYTLVKNEIEEGKALLYVDIAKKEYQYTLFDSFGPLIIHEKKYSSLTDTQLFELAAKLAGETGLPITRIVIGGHHVQGTSIDDSKGNEEITIDTLGNIIVGLLPKLGIEVDAKIASNVLFANVLGAVLLGENESAPNFAKDTSLFVKDAEEKDIEVKEEERPVPEEDLAKSSSDPKEPSESFFVNNSDIVVNGRSPIAKVLNKKTLGLLGGIIIALVAATFLLQGGRSGGISVPFVDRPTATPVPTTIPSATPAPTINPTLLRTDVKISVENGTEKTGFAKDIGAFLEGKGYKNVAKGNADKKDYTVTIVRIKKSKDDYTALILSDVNEKFPNATVEELESSSTFDAVIILGSS